MPACRRKSWKKNRSHNPYLEKYTDTGKEMTEEITPSILSSVYLYTCLNDPPIISFESHNNHFREAGKCYYPFYRSVNKFRDVM